MDTDRDFDKHPYSPDEMRVAKWFVERTGIGGGPDPIGALIASHDTAVWERNRYRQALADLGVNVDEVIELPLPQRVKPSIGNGSQNY